MTVLSILVGQAGIQTLAQLGATDLTPHAPPVPSTLTTTSTSRTTRTSSTKSANHVVTHPTIPGVLTPLRIDAESKTNADIVLSTIGCANNWERGYALCSSTLSSGTPALDLILDTVRRRIEHDDLFDTFLLSYSTAGGTGSGVSARLAMELKDWMPRAALVSVPILPFARGDTAVQAYNTVLALAAAQDHADAIIAVPNDVLFGVAERRGVFAAASGGGKGMEGVNAIAAEMLAAVVGSSRAGVHASGPTARVGSADCELFSGWDLVTSLCPIPMCKILHVASSGTVAVNKFHDAVKAMCRYTLMPPDRVPSCISATAYLSPTFSTIDTAYLQRKLNDRLGFLPAVNPTPLLYRTTATGTRTTASLAFVHNTGVLADRHVLSPWLTATAKRLRSGAYLHRYPNAAEWIGDASCALWSVVDEYRTLL
ncbi:hypothetical protein AMAG_10580 [Allomyces macrogynus ATCC 38327]|uniref:Tubulin/FtsZ GTPase domain-containing protein n=1 Tax=Allomyces macrogynus (strain ATCC 38327) TaxID=578462 RepID=A0A0L0SQY2_ALLM3|nr:hypothetical protein AMAG_10580 [Allomyces macrogynus ATCC 38327]|eukprot:KNE64912.1 hypothetical protein AMAG_10580 [Allomyces macrogynus ATCC 38327]